MAEPRTVLVSGERLAGWLERFAQRNGGYTIDEGSPGGALTLSASNGCRAVLVPPLPPEATGAPSVEALTAAAGEPRAVALILVRRGGYSVGVARNGRLLASKTGTRYVQSRTAAGGWSQQRFARRRANQASSLVQAAAEHASAVFSAHPIDCVQLGGDRTLALEVLAHPALAQYGHLPRLPFTAVPDPRLAVLQRAAAEAMSVRITITDPPAAAAG
ncbi:acVLRF1 family peptidyl-tRNA hydrolase [Arthrobacter zhaoguopingii]|uniref:acVLRF1 family peptidyl-tRNA hydrolase n=1 Tax=Arthrobacter zhaoguopingii TaxID=2681491 RepID=UPI00135758C5|nr:acVLRF1 family peptidyl-tRNA hydrolase [Arthrobacter zhaoguopingii]